MIKYYISYFELFNKKRSLPENTTAPVVLNIRTNEKFFSFGLIAINYEDPEHLWFHYKLDGFENEWHVTQDQKAVYINVSGG